MLLCVCSRCLIYKVHAAFQRAFILPKLKPFVKNFFRLHRGTFVPLRLCFGRRRFRDSLFSLPRSFASVKLLFSSFRTFSFESGTSEACPIPLDRGRCPADSLIILPRQLPVVKHFFLVL